MHRASNVKITKPVFWIMAAVSLLGILSAGCVQRERTITIGERPFEVKLWVSDRCPSYGETITTRATVTNRDSTAHVIELTDRSVIDISAGYRTTEDSLFRWSDGKPLTPELTRLELKPGEAKGIEMPLTIPFGACCGGASVRFYSDERSLNNPMGTSLSIDPNECVGH